MSKQREQDGGANKFGTFGGVFTPCTLTILGVIMFLRFGQVVGQAGIARCLLIVLFSNVITTLTSLSLSAIATNTRVRGGGAYYLISRSLGVEFGGAIGVVFFLAQAISVAMYVIGFTEALVDVLPQGQDHFRELATGVNLVVFICVYVGAGWTIKVQYFILAILACALGSFYLGAAQAFDPAQFTANLAPAYREGENLFTMFALFFPAVTGIMAGANMSGDLKNPARSIPSGTLAAVGITGLIYASEVLLLGAASPRSELIDNNLVIKSVAVSPLLITAGVFAATLSSALGSMMGAPRILQAFGRDEIFGPLKFFAFGSGASNEPRRATVLTFLIAQTCILLGDLNAIAPIITMFFMITYGTLNLATFYEAITRNPSYRPTFRYCHWSLSLLGAASCVGVMFLIDPIWAAISIAAMGGLHWFIGFREVEARWGDLQSGLLFERARNNLLRLEEELDHPKNWRPIFLTLSGTVRTRPHLATYGHWLAAGHGILMLAQVIHGDVEDLTQRRKNQEELLRKFIRDQELQAFPAVVVAPFLSDGIEALLQCQGLGSLRPNTVLIGWPNDVARAEPFGAHLRVIAGLGVNITALRYRPTEDDVEDPWEIPTGTIDVWWRGQQNGRLMLLLAHLLRQNPDWRDHEIRLVRVVSNPAAVEEVQKHLVQMSEVWRIHVEPLVLVSDDFPRSLQTTSHDAALVILGTETPAEGHEIGFYQHMENYVGPLPRVLFVNSAGGIDLES